jgi:hypothetical protein
MRVAPPRSHSRTETGHTHATLHRTHHGERCRVNWLQGDLDAMTETVRVGILPELEQTPGFCSASLLVNRTTGLCCATTAWGTREAMEVSRPTADSMRTRTAKEAGGDILDVRGFELAYAHLHVPEMACRSARHARPSLSVPPLPGRWYRVVGVGVRGAPLTAWRPFTMFSTDPVEPCFARSEVTVRLRGYAGVREPDQRLPSLTSKRGGSGQNRRSS